MSDETDKELEGELAAPLPTTRADLALNPVPWREAPVIRQVAVIGALALAIAIGVSVAMWSNKPDYTPLFSDLAVDDVISITEALKSTDSPFRIDKNNGAILVPTDSVRELRMRLASQGLPESSAIGLEILQQEQDLSTSQFIESARYNHALETELARSITTIQSVKTARVHLALPKQSIFVRTRIKPSASVIVVMRPGRRLDTVQIDSIIHLVSSSVAEMEASQVTVVDQHGRLLTDPGNNPDIALNAKQFEYQRELEKDYTQRIINLLEPIVGYGKVRAQVTADLNFNQVESTAEVFDPDQKDPRNIVRSEQLDEQENRLENALGVPGALTNQPPGAGTTDAESAREEGDTTSSSRSSTRNYEIDRSISYQRNASGTIKRLAVAVLIDDKIVPIAPGTNAAQGTSDNTDEVLDDTALDADSATGEEVADSAPTSDPGTQREPYAAQELERLTALVREVIGFNAARGDTINLMNSSFIERKIEAIPELPLWERVWVQKLLKQVLSGLFILLLLLLVVRPIIYSLIPPRPEEPEPEEQEQEESPLAGELEDNYIEWGEDGRPIDPNADLNKMQYDKKLEYARILIRDDPARAAAVIKAWVIEEKKDERDAA